MKLLNIVDYHGLEQCGELTKRTRLFTGYACNIKCKFCFYKDMKHTDIKERIYEQIHWGDAYGIIDWDISGGEPSILPYWFDILKDIKKLGHRNIACITNGYKFANHDFLAKSMDHGLNELLFSMHGSTEEIHDGMTGVKGSWEHLINAMRNAKYFHIRRRINVVVTKDNYKDLPNIAKRMQTIRPVAFNFLPFRLENSATKESMVRYSEVAPYIKEAIDVLNDVWPCKIAIRYVPFCLFRGYEKYVAGYLQRIFDEYEWSEYTVRIFESARRNKEIYPLDCETDKWNLEIDALHKSIKHVAGHTIKCMSCKYFYVCDGIWKSYARVWGTDEFKPINGDKTLNVCCSD